MVIVAVQEGHHYWLAKGKKTFFHMVLIQHMVLMPVHRYLFLCFFFWFYSLVVCSGLCCFCFSSILNPKIKLSEHFKMHTLPPSTDTWKTVLKNISVFLYVFLCLCVRSRFADFQHNCQPSPASASGCMRESRAMCLKAYAGLIGELEENK